MMALEKFKSNKKNGQILGVGIFVSSLFWAGLTYAQENRFNSMVLPEIIVQENANPIRTEISGFGDVPLRTLPMSAEIISAQKIQDNRIHRLSDATSVDASTTDSYNATGYWDIMAIRGYTLDNRSNFFREGLPISAETSIPLDNKERIEILKGLGGLQSGVSAPGGVINYIVKRPTQEKLRSARIEIGEHGDVLTAIDVGGHLVDAPQFGYRVNLAQEKLAPNIKDSTGSRSFLSLANDWKFNESAIVETEIEWSTRSQPSRAGFSLLGSTLPLPADPTLNLNNQPWTLPVVFDALTASARFTQNLSSLWNWSLIAGVQNLRTDDRLAYPFGCSAENKFDRYCSNGTFDMYDYRSENEYRNRQATKLSLQGQIQTSEVTHKLSAGISASTSRDHFQGQAYNFVGVGTVDGATVLPADPRLLSLNTNRNSANFDVFGFDNISWNQWGLWLGTRSSSIHRESTRTDGSRPLSYNQAFVIPWAALSYNFDELMVYFSSSQAVESFVTPNKASYNTPGEFLHDVTSKQLELGLRGGDSVKWSAVLFQIKKPVVIDQSPLYQIDGEEKHEGLELDASTDLNRWQVSTSAMLLRAVNDRSDLNPSTNGLKPTNVPSHTLRLNGSYLISGASDWRVNSLVTQEGPRAVTADNSISIPTWTRWDVGVSYVQRWGATKALISLSVENLTDQRYWREAPTQYGHIYLYPGDARSFLLSLQANL